MNYLTKLLFKPKIPVICLRETITAGVYYTISRQLNRLSNIKAIAVVIDSEKGEPVQTQLLANQIRKISKQHQVPVYSFVETRCTGEPCLLVGASDKSYCLDSSIVGVYRNVNWFGVEGLLKENNIEQRSWVSNKNSVLRMMLPFQDVDKTQLAKRYGEIQKEIADRVVHYSKSSKEHNQTLSESCTSGQYYIGRQAIQQRLIHQIGNVYSVLENQFPDTKLQFIQHSTILKQYLGVALALPFVGIVMLLGFKSFLKYFTLFIIYVFMKKKTSKKEKQVANE